MSVDPNVYALSVQLSLESSAAFATLDQFGQKASDIESNISTAAQNSIKSITGIADSLNQQLALMTVKTGDFANSASKLPTTLSAAAVALKDASDTEKDALKDLEKRHDFIEKIEDIQDQIGKSLIKEHKTGEEYLDLINRWVSALESKNLVHIEEGDLVSKEKGTVDELCSSWGNVNNLNRDSVNIMNRLRNSLAAIWGLIKLIDSETENFVQTNYRAYGSQQQLVNSTRRLSSEMGITRTVAIEAYKSLADVKTPRDEIDKLARTISIANRTTGVATETLAGYTRYLRLLGLDATKSTRHITMMTEAMRKYGLTQSDINGLMNRSGMEALKFRRLFGGLPAEVAKMEEARVHMAGFGKELGLGAEGATAFFDSLASNVGAMNQFASLTGSHITDAASFQQAQVKSGLALEARLAGLKKASETSLAGLNQYNATVKALADAHFGGNEAALEMTWAMGREAQALGVAGNAAGDYEKVVAALAGRQMDQWAEANNTLTGQLTILSNILVGTLGPIIQWFADGLRDVIKVLIAIIKPIAWVISQFVQLVDWVEANVPILGWLVTAMKVTLGVVVVLGAAILALGSSLAGLAIAFWNAGAVATGAANVIRTVAQAIADSIRIIFTGIGRGLAALGAAIRGAAVPLMQLGVAVLLVGAGFWLMGMGMAAAAEHGWAAVGMLAAMTIAMLVMLGAMVLVVTALAGVSTAAAPVMPLMLALAAVIFVLGAAAMMAGAGMWLIGESVKNFAEYGLLAAAALPGLAKGVILLGAAGLFGFAGILLAAGALVVLGTALWLVATPLGMIQSNIRGLANVTLTKFANALLASAWKITAAVFVLLPALVVLPFIIAVLTIAGAALFVFGSLFVVTAMLIGHGAWLFARALTVIAEGFKKFMDIDFIKMAWDLLIGGVLLAAAAIPFGIGAIAIGISAIILGAGLLALGYGAKAFEGVDFVGMAKGLAKGSFWLAAAAIPFGLSAGAIGVAALALGVGLFALGYGAKAFAGVDFVDMAKQLADGAWELGWAAIPFGLSATAIGVAALALGAGLAALGPGAKAFAGVNFVAIAKQLADGAWELGWAAIPFSLSATAIGVAALALGAGLLVLGPGVKAFVGVDFAGMAKGLADGTDSLRSAAAGLFLAGPLLWMGVGAALASMPLVNLLAQELDKSADLFQTASDKFVKPVTEIAQSLERLGAAMANIGNQGLMIQSDMDKLVNMLEEYTSLLESASAKMELAVVTKAVPAMSMANSEVVQDAARADSIATVQVMNQTEGGDTNTPDSTTLLLQEQTALLRVISNGVLLSTSTSTAGLAAIVELLETYLPELNTRSSGMSDDMNQWMK